MASPSLVRCAGGRMYFGAEALPPGKGVLYSSLKVSLLCGGKQNGAAYPDGLTNRAMVAAYFAWALAQIRANLADFAEASVFVNVAAPMSQYEDPLLKQSYLQIVQAAWSLAFSDAENPIHQGVSVGAAVQALNPLLDQQVLESKERKFDVLPETIAPVVSLSLDPYMAPGRYMIIDTGAGTTEMTVFHVNERGADQRVLCYQDETELLGGNSVELAERLPNAERQREVELILSQLEKQYCRVWKKGFDIDKNNRVAKARWKELTLVLSGGGTRHVGIRSHLVDINPTSPWLSNEETTLANFRHRPGTLEVDGDMNDEDASMFAVANGLSIERRKWPKVFQTDEIEPLDSITEIKEKPEPHWNLR